MHGEKRVMATDNVITLLYCAMQSDRRPVPSVPKAFQAEGNVSSDPAAGFHPTDEEVITHYLSQKILNRGFITAVIGEADLNKCEPWDLPSKAKIGEKEWYFFYHKDRKYPTGMRTNRATDSGYWKATGKDKEIFRGKGVLVGMKKTLVFYKGRAPRGEKSNWVMHEFRIEGKPISSNLPITSKDEWVVCRVFHKITGALKSPIIYGLANFSPYVEGLKPTLMDPSYFNPLMKGIPQSSIFEELQNQSKSFIPNNYFPLAGAPAGLGYSQAMPRPCKVEQFSNQSMASNEPNIDISLSSVVSKHEFRYEDLDDPSSSAAAAAGENLDLWNMWDY